MIPSAELEIINYYGIRNQLKKLNEECYELIEAVVSADTYEMATGDISRDMLSHITEELADCFLLMSQIRQKYGIDQKDIIDVYQKKIERQIHRMNGQYETK